MKRGRNQTNSAPISGSIHFTSLNLYSQYLLRPQEGAVNAFSTTAGFTVNAKTTGTTEVLCTH